MKTFAITTLLLAGFVLTILALNTEHRQEVEAIKVQIKSTEYAPGTIQIDGETFIVRYYSLEN